MGNYIYKKGTIVPLVVDTLEPITCASPSLKEQIERIASMSRIASNMVPSEKEYVIPEMPDSPQSQPQIPAILIVESDVESVPEPPCIPVKRAQTFTFVIDDIKKDRSSCSICTWSDESEENKSLYKMMKEMML
jgi:hypothetical protein